MIEERLRMGWMLMSLDENRGAARLGLLRNGIGDLNL